MASIHTDILPVLTELVPVFTQPTFRRVQVLVVAAVPSAAATPIPPSAMATSGSLWPCWLPSPLPADRGPCPCLSPFTTRPPKIAAAAGRTRLRPN